MKTWFQVILLAVGLWSAPALAEPGNFELGTGRDGPLTVASAGMVINRYAQVTGPSAPGDNVLLVSGTEGFAAGDLVMVFQVTGLVPEPRPGSGPIELTHDPVGRWELARLAAVGDGTLMLSAPLVHSYAAQVTQVIRIPEYTDVLILRGASLRAVPWNGGTGGMVAFLSTGTVHNDGEIRATGAGFRGGRHVTDDSNPVACMGMAVAVRPGAQKGEGVAVTQYGPMKIGRESVSNGGGGGVCPKGGGGGGGGNGGPGGRGGSADLGAGAGSMGGQGGAKLVHSMRDHLSFGGGGGSGHGEDWSGPDGGSGGGVIFVRTSRLSGRGSIVADGEAGGSAGTGGASGGGAGGSIYLRVTGSAACGSVSARGGAGGNTTGDFMGSGGPGGGGGGGRVLLLAQSSTDCPLSSEAGLAGSLPDPHALRASGSGQDAQPRMPEVSLASPQPPVVTQPENLSYINPDPKLVIAGSVENATEVVVYIRNADDQVVITKTVLVDAASPDSWKLEIPSDDPERYVLMDDEQYTIQAKAKSGSGTSSSSGAVKFTVDTIEPDTTIVTRPSELSSLTEAPFTFSSSEAIVKGFECSLDRGAFAPCTSGVPHTVGHGPHTFAVRAVDRAGNVDSSPDSYAWTVDLVEPDTSIGTTPPMATRCDKATFTFSSPSSDVVGFECSLDGLAHATCTSGVQYTGLSQGSHTFAVRAVDAAGNKDSSEATYSWIVDWTEPDTSIGTKPSPLSKSSDATFTFSSNEGIVTYQCSLDESAYATCSSGVKYTGLSPGLHSFSVRAVDAAGNVDSTPAAHSWTVDLAEPDTIIGEKPPAVSNSVNATFTFYSPDIDVLRFECSRDGGSYVTCSSGVSYTGLGQGPHTFAVRAVDLALNEDSTPATYSWIVDSVAPDTSIVAKPPVLSNQTEATFTFSSNEASVTYQCSLDGGAYVPCSSGVKYTGLTQGAHAFAVRAVDAAGNVDASAATHSWTVDSVAPDVRIHLKPPTLSNSTDATFTYSSTESEVERFECSLDDAAFTECPSEGMTYSGLSQGAHSFSVQAMDKAGNGSPIRYNWIVDTIAPKVLDLRPADGEMVSTPAPVISGRLENDPLSTVRIYLDGELVGETLVGPSGLWSFKSLRILGNGPHTVSAEATDQAGNVGPRSATHTFTVDTDPPDTVIVEGPPNPHNSKLAAFVFESPGGATEFEYQLDDASTFIGCGAELLLTGLVNGHHKIQVRAKDGAGNVDPEPALYEWDVLVEPPPFPEISEPGDGAVVNTGTPGITGAAVANSSVIVYIDNIKIGVALADGSGHWSFRPPTALKEGEHSLTAETVDVAGNTSEQRSPVRSFSVLLAGEQFRSIGGGLSCAASGTHSSLSLLGLGGLLLLAARRRDRP